MTDLAELVDRQNSIIHIQASVINDLFLLLMEYISVEEADRLPVVDKINLAASLRTKIGEE